MYFMNVMFQGPIDAINSDQLDYFLYRDLIYCIRILLFVCSYIRFFFFFLLQTLGLRLIQKSLFGTRFGIYQYVFFIIFFLKHRCQSLN